MLEFLAAGSSVIAIVVSTVNLFRLQKWKAGASLDRLVRTFWAGWPGDADTGLNRAQLLDLSQPSSEGDGYIDVFRPIVPLVSSMGTAEFLSETSLYITVKKSDLRVDDLKAVRKFLVESLAADRHKSVEVYLNHLIEVFLAQEAVPSETPGGLKPKTRGLLSSDVQPDDVRAAALAELRRSRDLLLDRA